LIADGREVPLGDRRYLLSPQDLAGLEVLPELVALGVRSLKIEGRLKSPEYVASITRIYRQALDRLETADPGSCLGVTAVLGAREPTRTASPLPPEASAQANPRPAVCTDLAAAARRDRGRSERGTASAAEVDPAHWNYELEMAFSRGLGPGWFRGIDNQRLVHARFGKKRGVLLGEVRRIESERVGLRLLGPVKPGDGVVFDAGHPDQDEEGGRVYTVESRSGETWLGFGRGDLDFRRIQAGNRVWKTSDPELDRRLRQTFTGDTPRFQRPLAFEVHGELGTPLTVVARDELGHVVRVQSAVVLVKAERQPLSTERLRDQLGRLGGTGFRLAGLENRLAPTLILPVAELNRLRREVVALLEAQRAQPPRWQLCTETSAPATPQAAPAPSASQLLVLARTLPQLEAALAAGVTTLYCEFENPQHYREAVGRVRHSGISHRRSEILVAPPRITKPGDEWMLKQVRSCDADGYLVRNYDQLTFFAGGRCVGDFSLNVANPLTAAYFKERHGLERLTASYDLNNRQLEALLAAAPPEWFEITIHQHMPMFHMEHCVFCAFLTTGTDYTNCGRPCDRQVLKLRDRVGVEHPVKADVGCRNTVFNGLAQTGAEYVGRLQALGARHFRLEFLDETPEGVTRTIEMYRRLLAGETTGAQLWRELKLRHQLGVTRGSLDKGERPITVL
jgi:putative protease